MANEETTAVGGFTPSFKIPKRQINIGGIDKRNRPFNSKFNRQIVKSEKLDELIKSGLIKSIKFGSKNCFFIRELSENDRSDLLIKLDVKEKLQNKKYSEADINDSWWTINTETEDGAKPFEELEEAIDAYHSYEDPEEKKCLTMYGHVSLSVDFSNLKMISDDEGVVYPYGILFFSDSKSSVNHYSARCALLNSRFEKFKAKNNNRYINQIDDWTNSTIDGSFRSTGHFVIFYVNAQEEVTNGNGETVMFPKVHMVVIETILNREQDGKISAIGIGNIEETEVLANHFTENEGDPFGSEVIYLIENVFVKYSVKSFAASHFASDYIYLIGDDPRYYNLSDLGEKDESSTRDRKKFVKGFENGDPKKNGKRGKPRSKSRKPKVDSDSGETATIADMIDAKNSTVKEDDVSSIPTPEPYTLVGEPEVTESEVTETEQTDASEECECECHCKDGVCSFTPPTKNDEGLAPDDEESTSDDEKFTI